VIVVIGELFEKRARLEYECGQDHLGQVHAGPDLFYQAEYETSVLFADLFGLALVAELFFLVL
jgi:hypothetical protein